MSGSRESPGFARHLFAIKNIAFTRILMDQGIYVSMLVFAAGLRHLIRQARSDTEWIGTLLFGAALGWVAVTVVADGLEGGAVLDTLNGNADPSAVRALVAGTLLIYNGSIAFAITGLFLASAAWATFDGGPPPRWTGWIAVAATELCVASVLAMYGGPVNPAGFYNAGGWGPAIAANFPPMIWFLTVSVILIRRRGTSTSCGNRPVRRGASLRSPAASYGQASFPGLHASPSQAKAVVQPRPAGSRVEHIELSRHLLLAERFTERDVHTAKTAERLGIAKQVHDARMLLPRRRDHHE